MSMFRSLKPNASHAMVPMSEGQGIKCALCGATGLQERVELPCPESDVGKLRERVSALETSVAELLNDPHGDTDAWSRARTVLGR